MAESERNEVIRTITFEGTFTVREEIRPALDGPALDDKPTQPKPSSRPRLGFQTSKSKPLPKPSRRRGFQSDICFLNDLLRQP